MGEKKIEKILKVLNSIFKIDPKPSKNFTCFFGRIQIGFLLRFANILFISDSFVTKPVGYLEKRERENIIWRRTSILEWSNPLELFN